MDFTLWSSRKSLKKYGDTLSHIVAYTCCTVFTAPNKVSLMLSHCLHVALKMTDTKKHTKKQEMYLSQTHSFNIFLNLEACFSCQKNEKKKNKLQILKCIKLYIHIQHSLFNNLMCLSIQMKEQDVGVFCEDKKKILLRALLQQHHCNNES